MRGLGMVTQMSASSLYTRAIILVHIRPCSPTAALAQELRQLPLEEAIRKAGQQRSHPLLVSKHAVGLCSCIESNANEPLLYGGRCD